ncbi:hypothetical protein TRSC58_01018 [Trypanosoma rangeli SC58]|uniref:Uncharacterized protein n=1 Tax=Trypanosoma rangeli SC58 TaxID=429131 RepID=A0A061JD47_TRYRA|nr:hypothetical protein TRSC58_01018 [Trypanosoma rangeli SC58]
MRKKLVLPFPTGKFFSTWDDGPDGHEWKSRVLAEKRSLALAYLGDVNKRAQIHDAIRLKGEVNRQAIRACEMPKFFQADNADSSENLDCIDYQSLLDMVEGEFEFDTLSHVTSSDASLLKSEFLQNDDSTEMKLLSRWASLRRDIADYHTYAAIPDGERNLWSAWYLRNVRANKTGEE